MVKKTKGPIRTEEEIQHAKEADDGAKLLVKTLKSMNRPEAEKHVNENMPSVDVIVGMAFFRQREASRHHRPNRLKVFIEEIVAKHPNITTKELLKVFDEDKDNDRSVRVIEDIDEEIIYFIDANGKGGNRVKISNLPSRISRARKITKLH